LPQTRYVMIDDVSVSNNNILRAKISYSKDIKKFFLSNIFYAAYQGDISEVSVSILHIPVIANLVTFAWAVGADLYVKDIDKAFLESLEKVKAIMKEWYPELPFSTRIQAENVTSNNNNYAGYGLLFSGGIDSTASFIRQKENKVNLIMIWGADIPLNKEDFWYRIKERYIKFAEQEEMKIDFIKTNMHSFLNERMLDYKFGKYLTDFSWWGAFQHGIGLLGLCAPLTVIKRIGTIFIASSHTKDMYDYHWGSHPLIDERISWANTEVVHDGYNLSRQQKIELLINDYIKKTGRFPFLRVCWSQFSDFNCSKCEKCSRTITELVLAGIDPNRCGFNINDGFFDSLKQNLIERKFTLSPGKVFLWKDIQRNIPKEINNNLYDSKEFFEWFRNYEISETKRKKPPIKNHFIYFFDQLPKNLQETILRVVKSDYDWNHKK